MLAPSVAPSRATFSTLTQETMKETKDGIFIGAMSPLLQCIENTYTDGGVLTTGPRTVRSLRVVQFVRAVEYACENFAALNSTVERQRWTHQEFRALCEAAGPVAAELSARALQNDGLDSAPVSESMLLEYLACHVSKATKEKVSKLAMVGRMVAAPSHRGTHGGTPVSMLSKATLAAVATPAFPAQPVAAENSLSSDAVPSTVAAPVDGRKRPGTEAKLALPKGRPQPSAEGRRPGSPPPPDKPERQLNGEKQMVIMPWTIPAPFSFGVLLRRVTPKTFKAPATLPQTIPTVADIANAAATDKVYALWVARETALRRGAVEHAPKSSVADDDDEAATLPAGPSGLAPPGPIFPHSSAQGAGLKQPSGIGSAAVAESSNPASSRHVNLRKPLLTAIAHYGIHTVHKTTPS